MFCYFRYMDVHSKRTRHNKSSKSSRKAHPNALRPIISGELVPQFQHQSEGAPLRASSSGNSDRLNDIIDDITSEGDDARSAPSTKPSIKLAPNLTEPKSPPVNDNRLSPYTVPSAKGYHLDRAPASTKPDRARKYSTRERKSGPFNDRKGFSPSRANAFDDRSDPSSRRRSIGELRRHQITECMEYYRHCLESAQHSSVLNINDDPTNPEKRKQYATTLW